MILYNPTDAQDIDTDTHWVPDRARELHATASASRTRSPRGPGHRRADQGTAGAATRDRVMAAFSSRGPQTAVPDLPKPDVTAPGVQILAGAADQPAPTPTRCAPGELFQSIQGTSMASPHVAGAARCSRRRTRRSRRPSSSPR